MALSPQDQALLRRAVALAEGAIGLSDPNPRVGCVLHDAQGRLIGEGHTQQAGGPHAEVVALRAAQAAGHPTAGGTAWVSLEPCAHHGRTPPCADALAAAGLARVVVAMADPFPQVAGQGVARLRAAGVQVDLAGADEHDIVAAAQALNIGFLSRVLRGRPWVRMKIAASLDGRTALPDGRSQWITGEAARADGQAWRRRASAVLTGIGTVRDDDPRLDVRAWPTARQPTRIVLDSAFRTPPTARVLAPPGVCVVIGCQAHEARMAALRQAGAVLHLLPGEGRGIDLQTLWAHEALREVNELHVEAGATLSGALWRSGGVDELLVYLAPKLLGPGRAMLDLPELPGLDAAPALSLVAHHAVGDDLVLRLQAAGAARFLGTPTPAVA